MEIKSLSWFGMDCAPSKHRKNVISMLWDRTKYHLHKLGQKVQIGRNTARQLKLKEETGEPSFQVTTSQNITIKISQDKTPLRQKQNITRRNNLCWFLWYELLNEGKDVVGVLCMMRYYIYLWCKACIDSRHCVSHLYFVYFDLSWVICKSQSKRIYMKF